MWCMVMFDLPTKTKAQRREYTNFRNYLLDCGFIRTQYSVYARYLPSAVITARLTKGIQSYLPPGGEVRIMQVTDRQWANTLRFTNATEVREKEQPEQLAFF